MGAAIGWSSDPDGDDRDAVRLRFHPTAAGAARSHLTRFLTAHAVPPAIIDDARLVVSELVANAVQHGRPSQDGYLGLAWVLDATSLLLTVEDAGDQPIGHRHPDVESMSGRGLHIIDSLTRTCTVHRQAGATMVSASIPLVV